jgi:hypothetical protein
MPAQRPKPTIDSLRKLIGATQKKFSGPRPAKGASMALRGSRGTQNAKYIMKRISNMNSKQPWNNHVANEIFRIFEASREGIIEPPSGSPSSDHQILVNIALALVKAEKKKSAVELNTRQMEVMTKYAQLLQRR